MADTELRTMAALDQPGAALANGFLPRIGTN
jgi:hypothetical protein